MNTTKLNLKAILADYLDPQSELQDIAARHGLDLFELLDWLETPEVAARLDQLERCCAARARHLAAQASPRAVEVTVELLESEKPETARRAASAIVRLAKAPKVCHDETAPQNHAAVALATEAFGPQPQEPQHMNTNNQHLSKPVADVGRSKAA